MSFTGEQIQMLSAPLLREHVKKRSQAGRQLSYIEGWHAIAEANRIFGFHGWNRVLKDIRQLGEPRVVDEKWRVAYMATVTITVGDIIRDGTGYGSGIDRDLGSAHESAVKEAETDAMKRALMTFGNPFGLALYDKDQTNVASADDAPKISAPETSIEEWTAQFHAQLKKCKTRHDVETAWRNSAAKRDGYGIQPGDDDFNRLSGFCKDRIEEIGLK